VHVKNRGSGSAGNTRSGFGFSFDAYIHIPRDVIYRFSTEPEDKSCIYLGGEMAIDNDGLHGMVAMTRAVALAAGVHPIRITFFQGAGRLGLNVTVDGPGLNTQDLPECMLFHAP